MISAPSGTGKTTVVKRLLEKTPNIIASVSFTTRPMRENEREGIDYFFVDKRKFETMVDITNLLTQLYLETITVHKKRAFRKI